MQTAQEIILTLTPTMMKSKKEIPPKRLLRDLINRSLEFSIQQGSVVPVMRENVIYTLYEYEEVKDELLFLAKDGWPIEWIINRPIISFLRRLMHTRKIQRYETWYQKNGQVIRFRNEPTPIIDPLKRWRLSDEQEATKF